MKLKEKIPFQAHTKRLSIFPTCAMYEGEERERRRRRQFSLPQSFVGVLKVRKIIFLNVIFLWKFLFIGYPRMLENDFPIAVSPISMENPWKTRENSKISFKFYSTFFHFNVVSDHQNPSKTAKNRWKAPHKAPKKKLFFQKPPQPPTNTPKFDPRPAKSLSPQDFLSTFNHF